MTNLKLDDSKVGPVVSNMVLGGVRWIALLGQLLALVIVYFGFGFHLPIAACLAAVSASALVGLWQAAVTRNNTKLSRRAVLGLLIFDTLQLGVLIYLTGGLANPFAILLIAPVTVSSTVLPQRDTTLLVVLVVVMASLLSIYHQPLPWFNSGEFNSLGFDNGRGFIIPTLYIGGLWAALVLAAIFIATYAGLVSRQSRSLARGLADAQLTMAREQQMVALGSLATAAAHKLGSPLNTIMLIAHELKGELTQTKHTNAEHTKAAISIREDISALIDETERCRKILAELNEDAIKLGQETDDPSPVTALVTSFIDERFDDIKHIITITGDSQDGTVEPLVIRRPELLHPLEVVIENAAQFAKSTVTVRLVWGAKLLNITIEDDGTGFQSAVLSRLGDPYNSSRQGKDGHMGLGIFIALTMIEQMGGRLTLENRQSGGARVQISYPRNKIDMGEIAT